MKPTDANIDVWIERSLVRGFKAAFDVVPWSVRGEPKRALVERVQTLLGGLERPGRPQLLIARAATVEALAAQFDELPGEAALMVVTPSNAVPEWSETEAIAELISARATAESRTRALKRAGLYALRRAEYNRMNTTSRRRARHLEELNRVGLALSTEHDLDRLLELIVSKARELTHADAGSLYLTETGEGGEPDTLFFKVAQNDTLKLDFSAFRLPLSRGSIAGYVAISGNILNLPDVYELPEGSEYSFNQSFDKQTNYRSKSMLVVPMINHQGKVIGVLQLINKKRRFDALLTDNGVVEREVHAFTDEDEALLSSLASQAAVAIENAQLYEAIRAQFDSFVKASVWAIEQRDPPTAGHSDRVTALTVALAQAADADEGKFKKVQFDDRQLREIYYAGMLHDFGKINVSEGVFSKAKKLYPYALKAIEDRFALIRRSLKAQTAEQVVAALAGGDRDQGLALREKLEAELDGELAQLDQYWDVVLTANEPAVLESEAAGELDEMCAKVYHDPELGPIPLLTAEEHANLSIPRGSLNDEERAEIQSHVTHSYDFLQQIPWTEDLSEVADIAWGHHEMLNGAGYPRGIAGDEIRIEARMMAICDIFDALTASDRPYKKAMPLEKALHILSLEVKDGKLDKDLVDLFVREKIYETVPAGRPNEPAEGEGAPA